MYQSYYRMGEYIVAEDLVPGESLLKLLPVNTRSAISDGWKLENSTFLPNGETVDTSDYIEALWLPKNSNRLTPPNVTQGSVVTVYRNKRGDEYYWVEETTQLNRRKLEEVTYRWSNRPEGYASDPDTPLELCNYTLTLSTLNQILSFTTSNNNEEVCGTVFNLDLRRGYLLFKDTIGNKHFFDMGKGDKNLILVNSHNLDVPENMRLIGKSDTTYNMGGGLHMIDGDEIVEISGGKAEKIKKMEQDIEELKQHIGTLTSTFKEITIAVENHLAINAIKIGKVDVDNKPMEVDIFNEAKDKVLEHFQTLIDMDSSPNDGEDKEEEEKRKKTDSEKHASINAGKTLFEVDVDEDIKIKTKKNYKLEAMQGVTIEGKAGTAIKGGGQDLVDILKNFFQNLSTSLNSDLSASTITGAGAGASPAGPVTTVVTAAMVPVLTNTIKTCTEAMTNIISFKGSASRTIFVSDLEASLFNTNMDANASIKDTDLDSKLKDIKSNLKLR